MLTSADIERFRVRLEAQRAEIQEQIAGLERTIASSEDIADAESDDGEVGNLLFAREDAFDQIDRARAQLAEVERALLRIADGSYGLSAVSGKPIPIERLEAVPTAMALVNE